jgi:hypothetical protein
MEGKRKDENMIWIKIIQRLIILGTYVCNYHTFGNADLVTVLEIKH